MKGKIVLLPFPFTDLTAIKMRPALVISSSVKDVVVTFISSRLPANPLDSDVIIRKDHSEFGESGLKVDSVIKLDKVATILKDHILGELGEIGPNLKQEINEKLSRIFQI